MEYRKRVKLENAALWVLLVLALALNVVLGLLWDRFFLDPRQMTKFARDLQRAIYFGFLLFVIFRLVHNRRVLREEGRLEEQERQARDERRGFLAGASARAGAVLLTVGLVMAVFVSSLLDMTVFATLTWVLAAWLALWGGAYLYYSRRY